MAGKVVVYVSIAVDNSKDYSQKNVASAVKKKIIDAIELFKKEILLTLENFKDNIDKPKEKINYSKEKEKIAIDNYNKLIKYLTD